MRARFSRSISALVGVISTIAALSIALASAAGQAPVPAKPGAYVPPRTPDGQPDFQGMWLPGGGADMQMERPSGESSPAAGAADEYAPTGGRGAAAGGRGAPAGAEGGRGRGAGAPRRTMIVDPADGKVPLQPWALARRAQIIANQDKFDSLDPRVRCLPAGIPRVNEPITFNTYQILQTPGHVVFLYEWSHLYRDIPLDGRPHVDPKVRLWMGDSRGHWEGNTLVVDATNFTDKQKGSNQFAGHIVGPGHPFGNHHVTERFVPISANRIHVYSTVEDPTTWTKPWTIMIPYELQPGYQIFEYACNEGNLSVGNGLRGQRVLDAAEAAKTANK